MLTIRAMTAGDLPHGLRLSAEAGWNQTEADWQRALSVGAGGCFVGEFNGQVVGTVATCRFDGVAWIGLMLVEERLRGRGFGKGLMQHALKWLDARGANCVRLDATPLGQPLYEKLGFAAQFELARFGGLARSSDLVANQRQQVAQQTVSAPLPPGGEGQEEGVARQCLEKEHRQVSPLSQDEVDACIALDRRAIGVDRSALLMELFRSREALVYRSGAAVAGYVAVRPGKNAAFIGPCLAENGQAGEALLRAALARCAGGEVMVDAPLGNLPAVKLLKSCGLARQRPFQRMARGASIHEQIEMLWASSGPEKG